MIDNNLNKEIMEYTLQFKYRIKLKYVQFNCIPAVCTEKNC